MKVRFIKTCSCSYGTFPAGREVDLPPVMLATIPKDCYEQCIAELPTEAKITETDSTEKDEPAADGEKKKGRKTRGSLV